MDSRQAEVVEPPSVKRLMIIAAHPDDLEALCAGTVAVALKRGAEGRLILTTSGDKGSQDPQVRPKDLARRREAETLAAAQILGLDETVFLRYRDGEVENTAELRRRLVEQIRIWRPEAVFTFDPEHPSNPYLSHRDHRMTGRAALDAIFPLARDPLNYPEHFAGGIEPHKVTQVWLFGSEKADSYVDISDGIDLKIQARMEHVSQNRDPDTLAENYRRRAAEAGEAIGLPMAERFNILNLR